MTNLNNWNEQTTTTISELQTTIADLQNQLNQIKKALDVSLKVQTDQENLTDKWGKTTLKEIKQSFKDACSFFNSPDVIESMLDDLKEVAEGVKQEFDTENLGKNYIDKISAYDKEQLEQQQDKETATDYQDFNLIMEFDDMPSENDDSTALTTNQVITIISPLEKPIIAKIQGILGINNRLSKIESIAEAIAQKEITHKKLLELINFAQSERLLLNGFNGNGKH